MEWLVGDIKVTSIVEQDLTDMMTLMPMATPEVLQEIDWLQPAYVQASGDMVGLIQAFVVETPSHRIVVDTCVGNDRERVLVESWHMQQRHFIEKFEAAGYDVNSIDIVLCTHMHFDHVGWNTYLDGEVWRPTFPNARYLFAETEYRFWEGELNKGPPSPGEEASEEELLMAGLDAMTRATQLDSITPIVEAGLSELVPVDCQVCEGVRLIPTHGHTPGHVSILLESLGVEAVITGDAVHHPVQIARPDIFTIVDIDPQASCSNRWEMLRQAASCGHLLIGSHFSHPTAGYVKEEGESYRFEGLVTGPETGE
jgi:glyoxylase-like metal-dependent hydrolase (beta-lactamase superfamily II)